MKIYTSDGIEYDGKLLRCLSIDGIDYLKVDKNDNKYQVYLNHIKVNSEYSAVQEDDYVEVLDLQNSLKFYFSDKEHTENKWVNSFVIPAYKTYPESTAILGILSAHNNYKEWLYNNYILMWAYTWIWENAYWCDFKFGLNSVDGKFCRMISKEYVNKKKFDSEQKVIDFFEKTLIGNYIFVALDMIVIDSIWVNNEQNRNHGNHTVLFYGYNPIEKEFYCADFIDGIYKKYTLSYDVFYGAFCGGYYGGEEEFVIWRYNDVKEKIDKQLILDQIKDFIKCSDTTRNSFLNLNVYYNVQYGFDALERIKKRLYSLCIRNLKLDLRAINVISTNVRVMKERISYLGIVDKYDDNIVAIEKNMLTKLKKVEFLAVRYNIKRKKIDIEAFIILIEEIISNMRVYYEFILSAMDSNNYSEIDKLKMWNKWDELKRIDTKDNSLNVYEHEKNMELIIERLEEEAKVQKGIEFINNIKKASNKQIMTSDFYENVFPLEIEEDGFIRNGQIIYEDNSTKDKKTYYYDEKNRVCLIEYTDTNYFKCWLQYQYEDNKILRLKYREKPQGIVIENIKYLVDKDDLKYLYSYKKNITERKLVTYHYNNDMVNSFERFECRDNAIQIKNWLNGQWQKKGKYIYSNKGELLQILLKDYDNNVQSIYTNLNRQYGEEKIKEDFITKLNEFLHNTKFVNIIFRRKEHKFIMQDMNKKRDNSSYVFLNEYQLDDSELKRISMIIAIEIYLAQKKWKDKKLFYYDGDLKIDISTNAFIE